MDACQFYSGENDGLMTGHLHPAAAPPPLWFIHGTTSPSSGWSGELFSRWTVVPPGWIWKSFLRHSSCTRRLGYHFWYSWHLIDCHFACFCLVLLLWGWGLFKGGKFKCRYGYRACQSIFLSTNVSIKEQIKWLVCYSWFSSQSATYILFSCGFCFKFLPVCIWHPFHTWY